VPPDLQALNYPSVAASRKNINLCLKPETADRILVPSGACMVRIEERADHLPGLNEEPTDVYYRTTFVRRSEKIDDDGVIHWSEVLSDVKPEDIRHLAARPPKGFRGFGP
jgi:hypothetical protein